MYFEQFPLIEYNGKTAVNLLSRVKINTNVRKLTSAFLPYDLEYDQRPDALAFDYYDDSMYDWLVFLSNDILDPYYDWYLNNLVFEEFIADKYGSYVNAQETIDHYTRNVIDNEDPYNDIVINNDTYTIAPDAVRFKEKSSYDMELEANEERRTISLINKELRFQASEDLERLLNDRS